MGPGGDEPVLVEQQHLAGIANRGKTVGHDEQRAPGHGFRQGGEDRPFRHAVEGRCRLIEDENVGILDEGPGQGKPLLLPLGEVDAALADRRFIPVG